MIRAKTIRIAICGTAALALASFALVHNVKAQDGRPFFGFPPFPGPSDGQSVFGMRQAAPMARQRGAQRDAHLRGQYASSVARHAAANGLPPELVHRVIMRESRYNPRAVSKGNYGMMQIRLGTARAMGYSGSAAGLLDPDTNMTYAVKYLAGAYRAAGGNHDRAVGNYARGYYYEAKRQGFSPYATASATTSPFTTPFQVANLQGEQRSAYASARRGSVRDGAIDLMTAKQTSSAGTVTY